MNGRMLIRGFVRATLVGITLSLTACATAPPQELSIIEAINDQGFTMGPQSCAALDAATVCVKSTRLDKDKSCSCADRYQLSDGKLLRF
jgi:hypothetical protein